MMPEDNTKLLEVVSRQPAPLVNTSKHCVSELYKGDFDKLNTYMALWYPDMYTGGMDSLKIEWLPEGTLFRINEYDGSESIEVKEDMDWMIA